MKCPRCRTVLRVLEYDNVESHVCLECHGEWLHAEELQKLLEQHDQIISEKELAALTAVSRSIRHVEDHSTDLLNCPHCESIELDLFKYAGAGDLLVQNCHECGGVWADKEELDKGEDLAASLKAQLSRDTAKNGSLLKKMSNEEHKEMDRDVYLPRFALVNAVLRRLG